MIIPDYSRLWKIDDMTGLAWQQPGGVGGRRRGREVARGMGGWPSPACMLHLLMALEGTCVGVCVTVCL